LTSTLIAQEWSKLNSGIPEPFIVFSDHFGYSNSMEGNVAVVGAPQNDDSGLNSGKVFVYEKIDENWQLVAELFSETSGQNEYFGSTVHIKDGFLFVSAPGMIFNSITAAGVSSFIRKSVVYGLISTPSQQTMLPRILNLVLQ
jgi:hypothetical protein